MDLLYSLSFFFTQSFPNWTVPACSLIKYKNRVWIWTTWSNAFTWHHPDWVIWVKAQLASMFYARPSSGIASLHPKIIINGYYPYLSQAWQTYHNDCLVHCREERNQELVYRLGLFLLKSISNNSTNDRGGLFLSE